MQWKSLRQEGGLETLVDLLRRTLAGEAAKTCKSKSESSGAILLKALSGVGDKPLEAGGEILRVDGAETTDWEMGEGSREEIGKTRSGKWLINLSKGVAVWKGKFSSWNITSQEIKIYLVTTSYNL